MKKKDAEREVEEKGLLEKEENEKGKCYYGLCGSIVIPLDFFIILVIF